MSNISQLALSMHQQNLGDQLRPFTFQLPQSESFNEVLLNNVDMNEVLTKSDITQCSGLLRNFVSSKITNDTLSKLSFEQFSKLFKICQLSLDYYTQYQEYREKLINDKLPELQVGQEKLAKLTEIEKKHNDQSLKLKQEMEKVKNEYQKIKQTATQNVVFKCHHCSKLFQNRDFLTKHLEKRHVQPQSLTNPEQLMQLLGQMQQNTGSVMGGTGQGWGATGQSWGLSNVNVLGTRGFEELKKLQEEKLQRKEQRRQERQERRKQIKQERINKLLQQQEMMTQMQKNMQGLLESKIKEMQQNQESLLMQQSNQMKLENQSLIQQMTILQKQQQPIVIQTKPKNEGKDSIFKIVSFTVETNEPVKQISNICKQSIKNDHYYQSISINSKSQDDQFMPEQPVDKDDYLELEGELQKLDDLSDNSIRDLQRLTNTQKKVITIGGQSIDNSALMSYQNYSYSQQSQSIMDVRTNQQDGLRQSHQRNASSQNKNQQDMAHIGELESDHDLDDNFHSGYQYQFLKSISNDEYIKPLNKKNELKKAEEEYLEAIYKKTNQQFDDQINEDELDVEDMIYNERKKVGIEEGANIKELQVELNKLQEKVRKQKQ